MSDIITPRELRFERLLDAPIETVWRYLAEPALRAKWFMGGSDDLRAGGTIGFTMRHDDLSDDDVPTPERYAAAIGKSWEERVLRLEPPCILAFAWDGGEAGEVTITLTAVGNRTRLVLDHTGIRGRDDAANFGAGWTAHLAALDRRVRGEGVPDFWRLHANAEKTIAATLV